MAFPEDYHINDQPCLKKNHGIHNWLTIGHPLRHRCSNCHKLKWIHNNPDERGTRSVRDGVLPRVY